jgi:uncharacterized surface protein with fasciclin (FAS1) repeats
MRGAEIFFGQLTIREITPSRNHLPAVHPLAAKPRISRRQFIKKGTIMISKLTAAALAATALSLGGCMSMTPAGGSELSYVGGAAMYPSKTIVENAVNSPDHTTLVAAVKAAGLVDTLSGAGPFTVFAPVNNAFAQLPAGTVDTLLRPENKGTLQSVLTYHVVPGRVTAADLMALISAGGGTARLTTVQGASLTAQMMGNQIMLTDGKGGQAHVTQGDVLQSNGVIHVIDKVLMS